MTRSLEHFPGRVKHITSRTASPDTALSFIFDDTIKLSTIVIVPSVTSFSDALTHNPHYSIANTIERPWLSCGRQHLLSHMEADYGRNSHDGAGRAQHP